MATREELLDNLFYTRDELDAISNMQADVFRLQSEFEDEKSYENIYEYYEDEKEFKRPFLGFYRELFKKITSNEGPKIVYIILAILALYAIFCTVHIPVYAFFWFIYEIWAFCPNEILINIVTLLLCIIIPEVIDKHVYKKKFAEANSKIDKANQKANAINDARSKENRLIQERNVSRYLKMQDLVKEGRNRIENLVLETGSWYPRDYYNLDAVNFFISAIQNQKADNIKECVNLYDTVQRHYEQLNKLDEVMNVVRSNMNDIKASLERQNVLAMQTLINTQLISEDMKAMNKRLARIQRAAVIASAASVTTAVNSASVVNNTNRMANAAEKAADSLWDIKSNN